MAKLRSGNLNGRRKRQRIITDQMLTKAVALSQMFMGKISQGDYDRICAEMDTTKRGENNG